MPVLAQIEDMPHHGVYVLCNYGGHSTSIVDISKLNTRFV